MLASAPRGTLWVEVGQEVSCPDSSLLFDSLDGIRQIRKLRCLAQFLLIYDIQVKPRKVYMFVVFIYCSLVPIFALCPRCCTKSEIIPALWGVVNWASKSQSMLHSRRPFDALTYTFKFVSITTNWCKTYKLQLVPYLSNLHQRTLISKLPPSLWSVPSHSDQKLR